MRARPLKKRTGLKNVVVRVGVLRDYTFVTNLPVKLNDIVVLPTAENRRGQAGYRPTYEGRVISLTSKVKGTTKILSIKRERRGDRIIIIQ